jgi:mRNA (guanine-N7-)-methyltransferase
MRLGIYDACLDEQFALHYSWSTEERARRALHNVSSLLQPGGYFIGTMPDANVIVRKLRHGMCTSVQAPH